VSGSNHATEDDLAASFLNLRRGSHQGEPTIHKPALLLASLGCVAQGRPRLVPFEELEAIVTTGLARIGNPTQVRVHYPFWRLRNDGMWEVPEADQVISNRAGDVSARALRQAGARGGFAEAIFLRLRANPSLLESIAIALAAEAFPGTDRATALRAFGVMPGS
jgi:putative restriction endonuclease